MIVHAVRSTITRLGQWNYRRRHGVLTDNIASVLDRCAVVGCLEYLDDFRVGFEQNFNIRLNIGSDNSSPVDRSKRDAKLSDAVRARVEEFCEPDRAVYQHALSIIGKPSKVKLS